MGSAGRRRPAGFAGRARGVALCAVLLAALLSPLLAPHAAAARNLALLVGVTTYEEPAIRALTGPRNDVILWWRYLTRHGFDAADIELLAEDLPQAANLPRPRAAPTRVAILAGLAGLAARAVPGDFILFHFSGHGSTQPQAADANADTPEAGGRDQVLLPRDAGRYDPATKGIRNALVDNEIGVALDRIRAKGATVWVIVDACHAGSVTRSIDTARGIDATALGVPAASPGALAMRPPPRPVERTGTLRGVGRPADEGRGALIAFFAVDSWTQAIERPYPVPPQAPPEGTDSAQSIFGVFTWHVLRALEAGQAGTFRDLARRVSLDIAAAARLAQAPLPVFEGDLDRGLPGASTRLPPRFGAHREGGELVIEAGALQGFDAGAEIALYDGPQTDARRLDVTRLERAGAGESRAPLAYLPASTGPEDMAASLWAQMVRPGASFRFRVASVAGAKAHDALAAALGPREGAPPLGIELVGADQPADLRLVLADGQLWLVPEGATLVRAPQAYGRSFSLGWNPADPAFATQLRNAVWAHARAANLVRIASVAEMAAPGADGAIDISLDRIRETDPERLADPRRACTTAAHPSAPQPVDSGTAAAVTHCDMVRLTIANRSERDVDIGVFFLDPQAGIDVPVRAWRQAGCLATLPARAAGPMVLRTTLRSWGKDGPAQIGLHRILVFALPRSGGIPPSLCHLVQRDVATAAAEASALRNQGGTHGLLALLGRAALADPTLRAANPFDDEPSESGTAVVRQFTLDLLPPQAAP